MQEAVPEGVGGIAAVLGLDADAVRAVCAEAAEGYVLDAVNLNSPGQVVIAGHRNAVERGIVLAKARGAKRAMMLPMSVPSHCALMKPAAERVADAIKHIDVTVPTTPVIQNADVVAHTSSEAIKQALVEQLYRPVRWIMASASSATRPTMAGSGLPGALTLKPSSRNALPTVATISLTVYGRASAIQ